jgi:formate hydrogenlyase subunit 3/multisubunit Na+/H+ antiporter MnhD subunit
VTALPLPGLAVVVAGLLGLGPVAWIGGAWLAARGAFVLCLLGAVLALAALLGDAPPPVLEVPVGLPGSGILLALDGVSALFLLALFVAGAAASAAAIQSEGRATAPLLPVLIGALTTTLLAADGFSITLAFEVATLAIAALTAGGAAGWRPAATLVGGGVCCGLCLVSVMALLAPLQPWGLDLSFAGMRAQPVEGWRATAVLLLVLLGAGGAAGLAPLHRWLATAQAGIAGADGALLCGAVGAVGLYVIVRVLFDLAGPAQPGWWGGLLVLLGAAGALLAAARSARTGDIRTVAGAAAAARGGLAALAVGLALAARAADLAPLAALALAAALLLMLA